MQGVFPNDRTTALFYFLLIDFIDSQFLPESFSLLNIYGLPPNDGEVELMI